MRAVILHGLIAQFSSLQVQLLLLLSLLRPDSWRVVRINNEALRVCRPNPSTRACPQPKYAPSLHNWPLFIPPLVHGVVTRLDFLKCLQKKGNSESIKGDGTCWPCEGRLQSITGRIQIKLFLSSTVSYFTEDCFFWPLD